jgi:hypothetical protein
VLLDFVPIGLAIAFDPIPLTPFLVVLPSKRGGSSPVRYLSALNNMRWPHAVHSIRTAKIRSGAGSG